MRLQVALLALLPLAAVGTPAESGDLPAGWFAAGSRPDDYDMGTDLGVKHGGRASGFLRSRTAGSKGFGTLMQMAAPGGYRDKRVRFSGWVKADKVAGWAGLWLRIDGKDGKSLGFDNMQGRPIEGTRDWTHHEIVLEVPEEAVALAFGVLLAGGGSVWVDDLKFEVVAADVPLTGGPVQPPLQPPQNLDLER